jgi:FemAB family protein
MRSDIASVCLPGDPNSVVTSAMQAAGAHATFRQTDPAAWDRTLIALDYIPVSYSSASIEYQLAYQRGHGGKWSDVSLILDHDHRPCGVWPLSFSFKDDCPSVTSHGLAVLPPLFVKDLPDRSRKSLVQNCLRLWKQMCVTGEIATRVSGESFVDRAGKGLSEWHDQLLRDGALATLKYELFVDLSLELEAIKSRFRKSYKSLITSGTRTWQLGEMTSADSSLWSEFRQLHLQVSGRVTRCTETWDLQHRAIADGNAFLIFLRDRQGKMIGGGFFNTTRDEGAYGVGAYDRSIFDKPIGHVVQYRAIEMLKERKLRWYKIGHRPYPSERPPATEKEISIGEFKQGFATHLFPQFVLRNDNQTVDA